ncbi:hypothetical protein EMIT0347P_80070 [Pseudomonas sp. IT-347P]
MLPARSDWQNSRKITVINVQRLVTHRYRQATICKQNERLCSFPYGRSVSLLTELNQTSAASEMQPQNQERPRCKQLRCR